MKHEADQVNTPRSTEGSVLLSAGSTALDAITDPVHSEGRPGEEFMSSAVVNDPAFELRRRKQAATNAKLRKRGRAAFRIIYSAEASDVTYDGVAVTDQPTPPETPM